MFAGDVLAFWVLAKGHQADIGGGGVVGYNPAARDAWEDCVLRIPCLQIADAGVLREDVVDFILLNVPGAPISSTATCAARSAR